MGVVLFGHPLVSVPELAGDDGHGDTAHGQPAPDAVPQYVKADRGRDMGVFAGLGHRPVLVRLAPVISVIPEEYSCVARTPRRYLLEKGASFVRKGNMAGLAALAGAHQDAAGIGVEVGNHHRGQLAIAATGSQGRPNELTEIRRAGVD